MCDNKGNHFSLILLILCLIILFLNFPLKAELKRYIDENGIIRIENTDCSIETSKRRHINKKDKQIAKLVEDFSAIYDVDPQLVYAVIEAESNFNPRAVSPKGAQGLMQLMPQTTKRYNISDPFDIRENLRGGVKHLKYLLDLFNGDLALALAAYNAGENLVLEKKAIPEIQETKLYVERVLNLYRANGSPTEGKKKIRRFIGEDGIIYITNR